MSWEIIFFFFSKARNFRFSRKLDKNYKIIIDGECSALHHRVKSELVSLWPFDLVVFSQLSVHFVTYCKKDWIGTVPKLTNVFRCKCLFSWYTYFATTIWETIMIWNKRSKDESSSDHYLNFYTDWCRSKYYKAFLIQIFCIIYRWT